MDDNQQACLGFSLCGGVGPVTFRKLVKYYSSPKSAFYAPESQLLKLMREPLVRKLIAFRRTYNAEDEIKKLDRHNIWVITSAGKEYPQQLLELYDPPICLFGKGDISMFDFLHDAYVGIVGTRKATSYGQQTTKWISRALSSQRVVIVSGMAIGIDACAHQGAIDEEGRTIAILGTPIDMIYPRENRELYDVIISKYGIVISEYPPGRAINQGTFVARNRIIAGLSQKLIVIEGGLQSGALITAKCAGELGRDVYAVPGPITSDLSKGPHSLIQNGAHVLLHPNDLYPKYPQVRNKESKKPLLDDTEKRVFTLLSSESLFSDEIAQKTHLPLSDTLTTLTLLEVKGIVEKNSDGSFTVQV